MARAGQKDSAMAVLERARQRVTYDIDPHQHLLSRIAYMYGLAGEYDRAIDLLKQYIAANPHHSFAETAGTVWWWRDIARQPRFKEEIARPR
jgi:tetratricopeptide (TPR) repeat protein